MPTLRLVLKKRDHRGHEGQKQKETREKAVAEQLPEHRPRVIPSEYGRNPERGSYGLYIVNPGYMALEVHIPTVAVIWLHAGISCKIDTIRREGSQALHGSMVGALYFAGS